MRSELKNIIAQLPSLLPDELDKLHQHVKALKYGLEPRKKAANGSLDDDDVIATICSILNSRGISCAKFVIRKEGQRKNIKLVIEFIEKAVHARIEQETLLSIAVDLLWQDLAQMHVPTTGNTLLRNLARIPPIMEKHFPGYAKSGRLRLIVNQHRIHHARQKTPEQNTNGKLGYTHRT